MPRSALCSVTPDSSKTQKQPDAAPGDHDTAKAQKRAKRLRDPEKEPF
jgi:hypothetical protein